MKYTYLLRSDTGLPDNKQITTYGIKVVDSNCHTVKSIPHIFLEKQKATEFVALCNAMNLEPIHLTDVIEDIKSDNSLVVAI